MKKRLIFSALALSIIGCGFAQEKKDTKKKNDRTYEFDPIVVSGTLKGVRKSNSPVPVTVIPAEVFLQNPTSNVLDALYQVNGLNPQVNCNMCNTSDISINGMPGPYTMVLIDGMPIVSSLSTVYGFSGIPNSLIKQVEVVKGPASSLYGSEAIGGVINIITKDPDKVKPFSFDISGSTWGELDGNVGVSHKFNDNVSTMFSLDGYYYNTPKDQDHDNYMDKTLQKRFSVFNKWDFTSKEYNRHSSIYARYYHENRHGGELGWNPDHRLFVNWTDYNDDPNSPDYNVGSVPPTGGYTKYNKDYYKGYRVPRNIEMQGKEAVKKWEAEKLAKDPNAKFAENMKYQESIFTNRYEVVGKYELPIEENITLQGSYNQHDQNSAYGTELFMAHQKTFYGQAYWDKKLDNHDLLLGATYRYTWFKDNTTATDNGVYPFVTKTPGIFIQDLWKTGENTSLLLGYRLDIDNTNSANTKHTNIVHSPRVAFKYKTPSRDILRASVGTGYRVVNIFSEDHRALSGQYKAQFGEELKPEKSISGTIDYDGRLATEDIGLTYDFGVYYTHFFNKIYPIRDDAARTLIYYNVDGKEHARSLGASVDLALNFSFPLKLTAGVSYNQAQLFEYKEEDRLPDGSVKAGSKIEASDFEFSPRWMGVYSASYEFPHNFTLNVTGNWKSPMLLPVQGTVQAYKDPNKTVTDPRSERSPWFTKVNTQLSKKFNNGLEIYAGVKNLFNYVATPLLVATNDPFGDIYNDDNGGLQFDTEYNYTPQQGRTGYIGMRFNF